MSTKIFGKHDIPKTGQVISYKTGDDGTYQAGSKANPRFVDNGDGTISDTKTRLMWQKEGSQERLNYAQAEEFVAELNPVIALPVI